MFVRLPFLLASLLPLHVAEQPVQWANTKTTERLWAKPPPLASSGVVHVSSPGTRARRAWKQRVRSGQTRNRPRR